MQATWYIAREGAEIVKGRGAHRPEKTMPEIPADIPVREPSLIKLLLREAGAGIKSVVSK